MLRLEQLLRQFIKKIKIISQKKRSFQVEECSCLGNSELKISNQNKKNR